MSKILILAWHPGDTKIATAGGFRRLYEILKLSRQSIVIIDKYPSIYKDLANNLITVYEYKLGYFQKFLEKHFPFISRISDRFISFIYLLIIPIQKKISPQIIYIPFSELPHLSLTGVVLKLLYHSRLVFCNLNVNIVYGDRVVNVLLHKLADRVITISSQLQKDLKQYGIIATVVNGVGFNISDYPSSKVSSKKKSCVFIGRHTPEKGILDLLEIWHKLVMVYNFKPSLITIGDIPDYLKKIIINTIDRYQLTPLITSLGNLNEKDKIANIKKSNVCVLPSYQEGWGIVPMEALSLGKPVVAYELPVYQESIGQTPAFKTVHIGDTDAFAKAIVDTFNHLDYYSSQAKKWYPRLSWQEVARKEWQIICSS